MDNEEVGSAIGDAPDRELSVFEGGPAGDGIDVTDIEESAVESFEPRNWDYDELGNLDMETAYLVNIGKTPLLTKESEQRLGTLVQAGIAAEQALAKLKPEEPIRGDRVQKGPLRGKEVARKIQQRFLSLMQVRIEQQKLEGIIRKGVEAKRQFVQANLRLVVSIAKKHSNRGVSFMDLVQEGNIGLIKGVEKFDPKYGYKFSTYGSWWIRQAMTRAIADKGTTIRIPVHTHDGLHMLDGAKQNLVQKLGRRPLTEEIAGEMNRLEELKQYTHVKTDLELERNPTPEEVDAWRRKQAINKIRQQRKSKKKEVEPTEEEIAALMARPEWNAGDVEHLMHAKSMMHTMSTASPVGNDEGLTLQDLMIHPNPSALDAVEESERMQRVQAALWHLHPREREVLDMRFGLRDGTGMTLEKVGELFNLTRERIRQIEAGALKKLRSSALKGAASELEK